MTSIAFEAIDLMTVIPAIKDRESLQLVARMLESQLTIMEAQMAQMKQLQSAVDDRVKSMGAQSPTTGGKK
jgi:glycerol-3-phosphate responsive antiterminator